MNKFTVKYFGFADSEFVEEYNTEQDIYEFNEYILEKADTIKTPITCIEIYDEDMDMLAKNIKRETTIIREEGDNDE